MTDAKIGWGSSFAIGDGATPTETFTPLAEVLNVTPPSDTVDIIDATHMASVNRTREYIPGLIDPGEASIEMNFVPGSAADLAIQALKGLSVTTNFQIIFAPGGSGAVTWTFAGFLTGYEPAAPFDDKMTATVNIKVTSSYTTGVVP